MMSVRTCKAEPVNWEASLRGSVTRQEVKRSMASPSSSSNASRSLRVSQKTSLQPFKRQTSVTSSRTKQDVKPSLVSPSSSTSRCVASSAKDIKDSHKEITKISSSSKRTGNFIDLPSFTGHLPITSLVKPTMKDLNELCPDIVESSRLLDIKHAADADKLLDQIYKALKIIGESWIDDHEWIMKSKYRKSNSLKKNLSDRLVEKVMAAIDGLIKNVRMQALVKLSPIDVKRLNIQKTMCQGEAQRNDGESVKESVTERTEKMEKAKEASLEEKDSVKSQTDKSCSKASEKPPMAAAKEPAAPSPPAPGPATQLPPPPGDAAPLPPPPGAASPLPPPPLPMALGKGPGAPPPPLPLPPPQPLPVAAAKGTAAPPPAPPGAAAPLPPPLLPLPPGKGMGAPPPLPLPMPPGKGPGAPPPPPLRLGAKKATGKLKRSTQLGELYRFLRGKIEGKDPKTRHRGGSRVGIESAPAGGKQGMAEALAEITKKSAYFQQIEADVEMYMKPINELKREISSFQSKDMTELQKFHLYIESVLEKLTDETKVLARCEDFPESKLEAIRVAAALYSKLQGMIKVLKSWKIESPAEQLFDKTERYFAKIRKEIDTLDQTKVEEEKKFKSHNIHFDFGLLIQIKELMVDISSGCMELALKEKREAKMASHTAESRGAKPCRIKCKTVGWAKTLWRAFQFAFGVYTFAGGQDDRADKITRELGNEIELILNNQ